MDHTQLECLQRCEQEAVYRHVRHLAPQEESIGAFFGRVVHKGVWAYYEAEKQAEKGGSGVGWLGATQSGSPTDIAASVCTDYWRSELGRGVVLSELAAGKREYRTPELAAALVRLYAARYPPGSRGFDIVLNERYMAHGEECGIVDRVMRWHSDGLLYVRDLKTSAWAPTAGYWRQWHNSQQAAIYLDLAEAELGEQVAGFWLDHIFVSSRKDGPKPEDLSDYGPITYSPEKRAELRAQRARWRELFRHLQALPSEAQQSTTACYRYQSACPYLELCTADPELREDMVQRDLALGRFVISPWEPAQRDRQRQ